MKTKVLMVYPKFPSTYWSFKHSMKFIGKKSAFPPLGLMTIAAMLPDNFEVKLIDMNINKLEEKDIINADLVFLSAMIIQNKSFAKAAALAKSLGRTVVAGGPYPTSSQKLIENVDHFILDEGEITLKEFLEDYKNGNARKIYTSDIKPDISTTPIPRFDLINVNDYSNMLLQFSRGCPFNCEFCDIIEMFGRITRTKTSPQFIKELDAVYDSGFRGSLFIVDDNFIGNKKKVKELLSDIIRWQKEKKFPFSFFTEASINCADDDELLSLLQSAGFDMLFVGIETPDAAGLALAQKGQNLKLDMIQSIKKIQRHGMEVTGGFIVGFDTDDETIFDRQFDFIQTAGIPTAMMGMLLALPNTQLYRRLQKENRLLSASSGNNTHDIKLNFISVMNEKKLIEGYKNMITKLYSPKNYFKRAFSLIKELPQKKVSYRNIQYNDLKSLVKSLFKQGFSKYSFTYFKFLFKTLLKRPRLFPEAIAMSIKGYHFFKITKDIIKADEFNALLSETKEKFNREFLKVMKGKGLQAVFDAEAAYASIKASVMNKYSHLAVEVKQHVKDGLADFDNYCENRIAELKKELHIYDTLDIFA